jgi:hypothetical protein
MARAAEVRGLDLNPKIDLAKHDPAGGRVFSEVELCHGSGGIHSVRLGYFVLP